MPLPCEPIPPPLFVPHPCSAHPWLHNPCCLGSPCSGKRWHKGLGQLALSCAWRGVGVIELAEPGFPCLSTVFDPNVIPSTTPTPAKRIKMACTSKRSGVLGRNKYAVHAPAPSSLSSHTQWAHIFVIFCTTERAVKFTPLYGVWWSYPVAAAAAAEASAHEPTESSHRAIAQNWALDSRPHRVSARLVCSLAQLQGLSICVACLRNTQTGALEAAQEEAHIKR